MTMEDRVREEWTGAGEALVVPIVRLGGDVVDVRAIDAERGEHVGDVGRRDCFVEGDTDGIVERPKVDLLLPRGSHDLCHARAVRLDADGVEEHVMPNLVSGTLEPGRERRRELVHALRDPR